MKPDSLFMVQVPVPAMRETWNWMGKAGQLCLNGIIWYKGDV